MPECAEAASSWQILARQSTGRKRAPRRAGKTGRNIPLRHGFHRRTRGKAAPELIRWKLLILLKN
jgi:hypothetical protein